MIWPRPVPTQAAPEVPEWQPGDPLYHHGAYRDYLFNFKTDPEAEDCRCADSARWPQPDRHALGEGDEIGAFIAALRRLEAAT